ncbi:hypothetical protein [Actinokineospora sp. NBRC 105648]|uniref:hypothetical protein n=1 Tax=Actinokineospora sp. NBRC 105648 TaxID=3032206 RepID=UPI0024A508C8|nr:hypothetical protein [Actinokineospora sp. NBRC 105648]GLZ36389.1 hypothetical protein Acsp05_00140 [Actinokineospora sp. NBRC 105648]
MRAIHDHIAAHLDPSGCGLLPGGDDLPDEVRDDSQVRWASGARDGVQGDCAAEPGADDDLPALVATALTDVAGYELLYAALSLRQILDDVDRALTGIRALDLPAAGLRDLGTRLVTTAAHREPVKFGIALLGLDPEPADVDLLLRIGRHDEFTRYAAVAVLSTHPDPEPVLLRLAKGVRGWGRIGVVRHFTPTTTPEARTWLLRGGFRNTVMNEYLAHQAATVGGLVAALSAPEIDQELLDCACDIVCALIDGGPAEDIDDYPDAPRAVWLLLGHLERAGRDLRHFVCTAWIEEFLSGPDWNRRYEQGWDLARHELMVRRCRDLMAEPHWRDLTIAGLETPDSRDFHRARYAARILEVDPFPATLRRTRTTNDDWLSLMTLATAERLPAILDLATELLPLADLATGPALIAGYGKRWSTHTALDAVVTALREFPGQGTEFVLASLRCPVVRNRVMAVRTLTGWGPESWHPEVQTALRQAVQEEPDPALQESMSQLLT